MKSLFLRLVCAAALAVIESASCYGMAYAAGPTPKCQADTTMTLTFSNYNVFQPYTLTVTTWDFQCQALTNPNVSITVSGSSSGYTQPFLVNTADSTQKLFFNIYLPGSTTTVWSVANPYNTTAVTGTTNMHMNPIPSFQVIVTPADQDISVGTYTGTLYFTFTDS